jgi:hypothetical protein
MVTAPCNQWKLHVAGLEKTEIIYLYREMKYTRFSSKLDVIHHTQSESKKEVSQFNVHSHQGSL